MLLLLVNCMRSPFPLTNKASGAPRVFWAGIALILAVLAVAQRPAARGDAEEYVLMAVALSSHATPDIRPSDLDIARRITPQFADMLDALGQGMAMRRVVPVPGFYRAIQGAVYSIHFHAYSALAVLPLRVLQAAGRNPLRAFQIVNLAAIFVLGLSLLRLFGHGGKALLGVVVFLLCGGVLYADWVSPECFSAAALLSALALFVSGAPILGGVLAGLASLQNPSIGSFCVFAPLARWACVSTLCRDWRRSLRQSITGRDLGGIAVAVTLFAIGPLFSLWHFGVPNVIVKVGGAAPQLASLVRLRSYFFDPNQGMIVAIPALAVALFLWAWRLDEPRLRHRAALLVLLASAMAAVLAAPALAVYNWNSGAAGVMRYAFWGAMPMLFAFMWSVGQQRRASAWPLTLVIILQAGAVIHQTRYTYVDFSPAAKLILRYAPSLYDPEPEIFAERSDGKESAFVDPERTYVYRVHGQPVKTMYNEMARAPLASRLCGPGRQLQGAGPITSAGKSWYYINGGFECAPLKAPAP